MKKDDNGVKSMNYIVLDLEWNQSYRGKEYSLEDMPFEIIEIGAVKMDEKLNIIDEWHSLIKPVVYTRLQSNIKKLLGITEKDLNNGGSFVEKCAEFLEWCGQDYIFCTWGSMDLTELQRNVKHFGVYYKFEKPLLFYDLQKLYSINFSDGKTRVNLKHAIEEQGIEQEFDYHTAINDARYTARIFKKLNMKKVGIYKSIDTFVIPKLRKQEVYLNFGTYEKYVSKGFDTREKAVNDRTVRSCKCFLCGNMMNRTIKWFATNSRIYFGLFTCENHGLIKGNFRIKQDFNGKYYAIRIMKRTDEAGALEISEKQLKEREHRRKRRQAERNSENK